MAKEFDPGNLVIVGAGFSFNAGLPLAGSFTKELLSLGRVVADGPSARQIAFIKGFADRVFGEGASRTADEWPDLEDIFTLVNLSANTGHHLGPHYSAADFEFKHLLKRVQPTEGDRPNITVITGGRDAETTIDRYKKFFGDVKGKRFVFKNGLDSDALRHLKDIKVLRA